MDLSGCIVHYEDISVIGKLRKVSTTTLKTLKESKVAGIALGGDNLHQLQSNGIPETLDKTYYVHPKCYKKFTFAVTLEKRKRKKKSLTTKYKRQKLLVSALNERGKFGANCGICKKRQIKVGRKYQYPKQIRTTDAEKNLKEAVKFRKDQALLLQIHEVDLIAKE